MLSTSSRINFKFMKKRICYLLLLLVFVNCKKNISESKTASSAVISIEEKTKFEAVKYFNEAILLTDSIAIYDSNGNIISQKTNVFGEILKIDSITKNKLSLDDSKERCDLHNFVKVNGSRVSGWVYGQFLFEKENKKRDVFFSVGTVKFQILPTKNFGIGVYDEENEGLSFCGSGIQNPILFYNGLYKKYEYLPLLTKNENYPENYLTLDTHDGWDDTVKKYDLKENTLILEINREYQEGSATIVVEIKLNEKQSVCKVISVEKEEGFE